MMESRPDIDLFIGIPEAVRLTIASGGGDWSTTTPAKAMFLNRRVTCFWDIENEEVMVLLRIARTLDGKKLRNALTY